MTDAQAPEVPPPTKGQQRHERTTSLGHERTTSLHERTTSLVGEFQFDLPLRASVVACNKAIEGLGWPIDKNHIVSYADTASNRHPPKIEVELRGSGETTDVRITGTDSDAGPQEALILLNQALIMELNRVRDAIKAEAEAFAPLAEWSS
jgi:hypothetical protein